MNSRKAHMSRKRVNKIKMLLYVVFFFLFAWLVKNSKEFFEQINHSNYYQDGYRLSSLNTYFIMKDYPNLLSAVEVNEALGVGENEMEEIFAFAHCYQYLIEYHMYAEEKEFQKTLNCQKQIEENAEKLQHRVFSDAYEELKEFFEYEE